MGRDEPHEFRRERLAMLRSLDPDQFIMFRERWLPGSRPISRSRAEVGLHRARVACGELVPAERERSRRWLKEHGYRIDGSTDG
jgi:hypothetical protein